jgi:hypothetical protein
MAETNAVKTGPESKAAVKAKERSPNYPSVTLTDAIGLSQKLYEKEKRTAVSPELAARAFGYGSLSGAARTALASLKQYGLVENSGSGIRLSDLAMDILHNPLGSPDRNDAISAAARRPPLIGEMRATHADSSDESLRAYMITRKKFSPDGAARFVAAFRDALRLMGPEAATVESDSGPPNGSETRGSSAAKGSSPPNAPSGAQMHFIWPLSADAVATLTISRVIELDDIDTLTAYFEIAKKTLRKVAKGREDNSTEPT